MTTTRTLTDDPQAAHGAVLDRERDLQAAQDRSADAIAARDAALARADWPRMSFAVTTEPL